MRGAGMEGWDQGRRNRLYMFGNNWEQSSILKHRNICTASVRPTRKRIWSVVAVFMSASFPTVHRSERNCFLMMFPPKYKQKSLGPSLNEETTAFITTWPAYITCRSVNRRAGSTTSIPRTRLVAVADSQSGRRNTPFEMFLYSSGYFGAEKGKQLWYCIDGSKDCGQGRGKERREARRGKV